MYVKVFLFYLVSFFLVTPSSATDYDEWLTRHQKDFRNFKESYTEKYQEYRNRILERWGDKTVISNNHQYVVYQEELGSRIILDYKANEIILESIDGSTPKVGEALKFLRKTSINQALKNDPVLPNYDLNFINGSLLDSFISDSDIDTVVASETHEKDTANVKSTNLSNEENSSSRDINRVRLNLNDDLYFKRAKPFVEPSLKAASDYDVDLDLILAITQVESSFNPMAQSPVPAFGLMQIVPESAGLDVNTLLNEIESPPTSAILFKPEQNLAFGAGYLHLLNSRYLTSIENEESRLYCIIAAYNTGVGNVASVFHPQGKKIIAPSIKVINTLTPKDVYDRLYKHLPYKETRDYLYKVTTALEKFKNLNKPY